MHMALFAARLRNFIDFLREPVKGSQGETHSTLSMATDSKLIHSKRKATYIPVEPPPRARNSVPQAPRRPSSAPRYSTPGGSMSRVSMGSTSQGACASPRTSVTGSPWSARPHSADRTARSRVSGGSPYCDPTEQRPLSARLNLGGESPFRIEHELTRAPGSRASVATTRLAWSTQECKQLKFENHQLRKECDAIRRLYLRDRHQQIDMSVAEYDASDIDGTPAVSRSRFQRCMSSNNAASAVDEGVCLEVLREDRDYWREIAHKLEREMGSAVPAKSPSEASTPMLSSQRSRTWPSESGSEPNSYVACDRL